MRTEWESLFKASAFFCLKKAEPLDASLEALKARALAQKDFSTFHAARKEEFLLGRVCAFKAYEECFGRELTSLPSNGDRSPLWPDEAVGSLSHDAEWVGAAVAPKERLLGVGIDFERRGRVKERVGKMICNEDDLSFHPSLSEEDLLTLIFSAKESLYKALYPQVKKFFGFEDAALLSVDVGRGDFVIRLRSGLSLDFGPSARSLFAGRFALSEESCLTVLEIF